MISFIVAMDNNHVIGANNQMPWHLPRDLKFFKEKTTGNTIVMGRKTFQSLGRVLPNRHHIVVTNNKEVELPEEVEIIYHLEEIVTMSQEMGEKELFVIGGGTIFTQLLPYAERLYITLIDETFEGDVYFPTFDTTEWKLVSKEKGIKDDKNQYDYYFCQYDRIK